MSLFVGFDTSNYTTSVAVYNSETNEMKNCKKLLPVEQGQKGLMQSKALFEHIRQLPQVSEAAFSAFKKPLNIKAIGVSEKPRMVEGSYMPVFLAGVAVANALSQSYGVPIYKTAHQNGHIISALFSANRMDLINKRFVAFHISGGTTEALLVSPDENNIINCKIISKSLDLNCGQVIDRTGVMLGLAFPSGQKLDELSRFGSLNKKPKPVIKDFDCCLSGVENQCLEMLENGEKAEDIARYSIEFIYETIVCLTSKLQNKYGDLPIVYAGGVMSNSIIRERLLKKGGIFCEPSYSSDNAAGVAIISKLLYDKEAEGGK